MKGDGGNSYPGCSHAGFVFRIISVSGCGKYSLNPLFVVVENCWPPFPPFRLIQQPLDARFAVRIFEKCDAVVEGTREGILVIYILSLYTRLQSVRGVVVVSKVLMYRCIYTLPYTNKYVGGWPQLKKL
jgi:hypothetical protein